MMRRLMPSRTRVGEGDAARPVSEVRDREHRLGQTLELRTAVDLGREKPREPHVVLDLGGVCAPAVHLQAHPDLERLEAARELDAALREPGRSGEGTLGILREVLGELAEGRGEAAGLADERGAGLVGHVHPLVRVGGDGVGPLHARKERPQRGHDRRQGAVGAVDVVPHLLARAHVGELRERIDRAGVDGAGVAHQDRGKQAVAPVGGDRLLEEIQPDAEGLVGRNLSELPRPDSQQVRGLVDAGVDLVRGVDGQPRAVRSGQSVLPDVAGRLRPPRHGESGEVRHGPARDEDALGRRRKPEHLGEPPDDATFDVRRGVIAAPAVRVHAGSQEVREDADGIRRRVDEAVEARMGVAHRIGHDVLAHEREDLLEGLAFLGQWLVEEGCPVADLPEDGPRIEALAMRGDRVRRERPQTTQLAGGKVERGFLHGAD